MVLGSLYALDAGPYSEPLFSFEVAPDQEIPPIEPRAVVDVSGEVRKGTQPIVIAGGVRVVPVSRLHEGAWFVASRLFAQNDSLVRRPTLAAPTGAAGSASPGDPSARTLRRSLSEGSSVTASTASEAMAPFERAKRNFLRGFVALFAVLALVTAAAALATRIRDSDLYLESELRRLTGRVVVERAERRHSSRRIQDRPRHRRHHRQRHLHRNRSTHRSRPGGHHRHGRLRRHRGLLPPPHATVPDRVRGVGRGHHLHAIGDRRRTG